jgi:isopentenyl diphosphate isomerase/L-lactate dehydrogenase-like FMN-dependent dehydrogenase
MARPLPPTFVAYEDFLEKARKVLPPTVFSYLHSGIGEELGLARNRDDLRAVIMVPKVNGDRNAADTAVSVFGRKWAFPFGVSPVGRPGIICPGVERALARAARDIGIPCGLSTVASATIEEIAPIAKENFWFQLYPIQSDEVRADVVDRAAKVGCEVLLVTVDCPVPQRREKAMRHGLQVPVRLAPTILAAPFYPRWAWRMIKGPNPVFLNMEPYMHAAKNFGRTSQPFGPRDIAELRKTWKGKLVVKGVMDAGSAAEMAAAGADGILVSNHGGRQLDAAPSPVRVLPGIRKAVGDGVTVLADGGATSGLDILKLLRLGADFVLVGKYPYTAVGALGLRAARPALDILCDQISTVMMQLGVRSVAELKDLTVDAPILNPV